MFCYKSAAIDYRFEFVNDIESVNLNFVIGCLLVEVGFLGYGGLGAWFITDYENTSPAVPNS